MHHDHDNNTPHYPAHNFRTMDEAGHEIDERWFAEWLHFGMTEMGRYLAKHNEFATYCANSSTASY